MQGIATQMSDEIERSATDDKLEIKSHILGPFSTLRIVYKTIKFSKKTAVQQKFENRAQPRRKRPWKIHRIQQNLCEIFGNKRKKLTAGIITEGVTP